jgi:hypothetical protein
MRALDPEVFDTVFAAIGHRQEPKAHGTALAGRTHQLMALELRRPAPQHRSQAQAPPGLVRPGRCLLAHRQAHRLPQPMVTWVRAYPLTL